jgi:hypothetical protein
VTGLPSERIAELAELDEERVAAARAAAVWAVHVALDGDAPTADASLLAAWAVGELAEAEHAALAASPSRRAQAEALRATQVRAASAITQTRPHALDLAPAPPPIPLASTLRVGADTLPARSTPRALWLPALAALAAAGVIAALVFGLAPDARPERAGGLAGELVALLEAPAAPTPAAGLGADRSAAGLDAGLSEAGLPEALRAPPPGAAVVVRSVSARDGVVDFVLEVDGARLAWRQAPAQAVPTPGAIRRSVRGIELRAWREGPLAAATFDRDGATVIVAADLTVEQLVSAVEAALTPAP